MDGRISWSAIANIAERLLDGRDVLLWDENAGWGPAAIGWYSGEIIGWLITGTSVRLAPTHFAEIERP